MRQGLNINERLILPLVYDSDATAQHKNKRKNSAYLLRSALRIFFLKRQKKSKLPNTEYSQLLDASSTSR